MAGRSSEKRPAKKPANPSAESGASQGQLAPWGIHWFRRDLRIAGNPGLQYNFKEMQGRTLGLFCFDSQFLQRTDFSHNRFGFFLETLKELQCELQCRGGDLWVVDEQVLPFFAKGRAGGLPHLVTWCRDYEPFARQRDSSVQDWLKKAGVAHKVFRDHLIFEPEEIVKGAKVGEFYKVFSPFAKRWLNAIQEPDHLARITDQDRARRYFLDLEKQIEKSGGTPKQIFKLQWSEVLQSAGYEKVDALQKFQDINKKSVTIALPEAGFAAAYRRLQSFVDCGLPDYFDKRDLPAERGTSGLSIYLKNGSLTTSQVLHAVLWRLSEQQKKGDLATALRSLNWQDSTGPMQFIKEVIWREFYYAILFHQPEVENSSFLPQYRNLKWENNSDWFALWQKGLTGFPIVDAGMRQLAQTGWMHNRVRMIVASFLTKDLLIDWRWGENHFMKLLLDGDLAPNNGGWQWAASTGCDPQPYFRIFNPWLQSQKFDPQGLYIKKYISELASAPEKLLHDPDGDRSRFGYPAPIVVHGQQRARALALFSSHI